MFPLADLQSVVGTEQTENRVGCKRRIVRPEQEFCPVAGGEDDGLLNAFRPGQLHQDFVTARLADPEPLADAHRRGPVIQSDNHQCGVQGSLRETASPVVMACGGPKVREWNVSWF